MPNHAAARKVASKHYGSLTALLAQRSQLAREITAAYTPLEKAVQRFVRYHQARRETTHKPQEHLIVNAPSGTVTLYPEDWDALEAALRDVVGEEAGG